MEPVEISAEGLLLRTWQPTDLESAYRACQDPLVQRWAPVASPFLREHAEHLIRRECPDGWRRGTSALFAAVDPATDQLLGAHGLWRLNLSQGDGEIGFWVAPWARGRRVAERATRAVSRWALDVLGLERLLWRTEVGNHAARLVVERVGFTVDGPARGLLRRDSGIWVDGWRGTLLPGEILPEAPAWLAPGSFGAAQARTFGAPQPRIPLRLGDPGTEPDTPPIGHLRPPESRDIPAIVHACGDPDSTRWTGIPTPYPPRAAESFVHRHAPGHWARGEAAMFTLADADDAWVGRVDLHLDPRDRRIASVAFLTAPHARGQGYASAGVRALCDWGFASLGLTRIEWRAHVGNVASRRVAEKAGFTLEGLQRRGCEQRGERRDAWTAALLAPSAPVATEPG